MYSQASQYFHAATVVEEMTECDDRIECMLNHNQQNHNQRLRATLAEIMMRRSPWQGDLTSIDALKLRDHHGR